MKDLQRRGELVRIKDEVDPHLEMAAIHRRVFERGGPAILFENVKGSSFPAVSNIFGTMERGRYIFRHTLDMVRGFIQAGVNPAAVMKNPAFLLKAPLALLKALPKRALLRKPVLYGSTTMDQLPQIHSWPEDGGPFITLPQVYSEMPGAPSLFRSNMGMYRVQMGGNEYIPNSEAGLHYQIHRGIGIHHTAALERNEPLPVSVFVGGPPSHLFSGVMPLPENVPEVLFAGILEGYGFRYLRRDGNLLSTDADFVITGTVEPDALKPEGPFGDHLGYYSLTHPFPFMKVKKVYHRRDAVWPFTVVGRPPQEDTIFGTLIHEMTGEVISGVVPGVQEVHAVDAAGVHPLLLAKGSERYTPYLADTGPQEILTQAMAILGYGQMSLAKYLFIASGADEPALSVYDVKRFFIHMLQRIDLRRDLHFITRTTMDTLDYSGGELNSGSKVVIAAHGPVLRSLGTKPPSLTTAPLNKMEVALVLPGVLALQVPSWKSGKRTVSEIESIKAWLKKNAGKLKGEYPLVILTEKASFLAESLNNFLWAAFTRSDPARDIFGVDETTDSKHWSCKGPLIIDARHKPWMPKPLEEDPETARRADSFFARGGVLETIG